MGQTVGPSLRASTVDTGLEVTCGIAIFAEVYVDLLWGYNQSDRVNSRRLETWFPGLVILRMHVSRRDAVLALADCGA